MYSMFYGNYQEGVRRVLERYLRVGDTFIDVGANVGYVSAIGMGLVGRNGAVHAFEPVPEYFARLQNMQRDNPEYTLHVNPVAVGDQEGSARMAVKGHNIGASSMVPSRMRLDNTKEEIEVGVITLTDYLAATDVRSPRLVKIDVEGYEFPVIKGFEPYLREAAELPLLVVEVNPPIYPEIGATLGEFANLMSEIGYASLSINCADEVRLEHLTRLADVVFLPRTMIA